ncbi:SDR family oxidoreductase [Amycolatopsis sp. NPDC049253]|uniref:SDR family NAD(P)-dependent oxidoreductase n=1 Tax=Amycolatopsis sp. NPDC049253 TaxID=3155274 RepID=UPI003440C603
MTAPSVVVTGAASGIGRAVTELCLARGAQVVGLDLGPDEPHPGYEDSFFAVRADVSDEASVSAAVEKVLAKLGGVDWLVNCAGIGGYTGDVTETSPAAWRRVLEVNLTGAYLVSRAVLPAMRGRPGAAIVHVSSQYGMAGGAGFPAYCAAKAGVIGLTRAMAVDHAPDGIRVNCVCPGPTDTPMLSRSDRDETGGREAERVRERNLFGEPAPPQDVAEVIGFLLGSGAASMTGAVVPVDGGWTAG